MLHNIKHFLLNIRKSTYIIQYSDKNISLKLLKFVKNHIVSYYYVNYHI